MKKYTEKQAVAALKRIAERWPDTLWIFTTGGYLHVMRNGPDGEPVYHSASPGIAPGVDPDYVVASVRVPSDGGDW